MSIETYLAALSDEHKPVISQLVELFTTHLPEGFTPCIAYNMITFAIPHSTYPAGYHCDPKIPLPFISIGAKKTGISMHHMGLYSFPELNAWFVAEFPKYSRFKLDMGKGCVRFKKPEHIPFELIEQLAQKITPEQWIAQYESLYRKKK